MVLMSSLLNNIKTLINQYVYTKEETRENFDDFIDNNICYINGNLLINESYIDYFDDAQTNNSSHYIFTSNSTNATLSYDTENKYYILNTGGYTDAGVVLNLYNFNPCNCKISVDFLWYSGNASNGGYNATLRISDVEYNWNNHIVVGTWSNNKVLGGVVNGSDTRCKPSGRLNMGTWYTFQVTIANNSILSKIIDTSSQNVIASCTTEMIDMNKISVDLVFAYVQSVNYFKNIKIEEIKE